MPLDPAFARLSSFVARLSGRPLAFAAALSFVLGWFVAGPIFHFSDTWQLVVNTGSSIITLLMVFLIQDTQNRESAAIQAKLNELLKRLEADTRYVAIEHLPHPTVESIARDSEAGAGENARRTPDQP